MAYESRRSGRRNPGHGTTAGSKKCQASLWPGPVGSADAGSGWLRRGGTDTARPRLTEAVVVMLTSARFKRRRRTLRELGIKAYLSKPIRRRDLLEAIKLALFGPSDPVKQSVTAVCSRRRPATLQDPAGRRQPGEPKSGHTISGETRAHRLPRRYRKESVGGLARAILRPYSDGRSDAGNGWL